MSSGSSATLLGALLVCLTVAVLGGVTAADAGGGLHQVEEDDGVDQNTSLIVELQANGDARWTVSTTFNLTTANETQSYRELAEAFENGETSSLGLQSFERASSLASDATGREMAVVDANRRTAPESVVENGTGRLSLSFTWTNFGQIEGGQLLIGDVFQTGEGLWLDGLEPDQTLIIRPPEGYGVINSNVAPENRTLKWTGPASFGPNTLDATFTGSAGPGTVTATPTPNDPNEGDGFLWAGLFILAVGALAIVGYLVVQQEDISLPVGTGGDSPASEAEPAPPEAAANGDQAESAAATAESEDEDTDGGAGGIDEELLSDEERVERLLEENGGRMKQARIVKETGWSNAKVSQLLSAMQEDERIDKLRIGRENLISFPDEDITDIEE